MILDTNALSAIAAAGRARNPAIPVIVLGECRFGVGQSRRRDEYDAWVSSMLAACRVLELNVETAAQYAELRLDRRPVPPARPSDSES